MPTSTYITLVIIYTLEAVLTAFGNTFAIFVFWTEKSRLKRTYFLLINLAVADLLVGITEFIIIETAKSHNVGEGYGFLMRSRANPIAALILLFSGTSVYFLALISMERAFAVLQPIRHRITNSRVYNCSIDIVWAVGLAFFGFTLLSFHYSDFVGEYVFLTFRTFLLISFLIICVSYLSIRTRLRAPPRAELDNHRHRSREHNLRFSKTFFYSNCFVACVLDACFCCLLNERILSAMLYTTCVLARGCHVSGKFYGESSRVQFQNANF